MSNNNHRYTTKEEALQVFGRWAVAKGSENTLRPAVQLASVSKKKMINSANADAAKTRLSVIREKRERNESELKRMIIDLILAEYAAFRRPDNPLRVDKNIASKLERDIVELMKTVSARIVTREKDLRIILLSAISLHMSKLVKALLDAGWDPNAMDEYDSRGTPMGFLLKNEENLPRTEERMQKVSKILNYLLEAGADPNKADITTPLFYAILNAPYTVRKLLESGANPNREQISTIGSWRSYIKPVYMRPLTLVMHALIRGRIGYTDALNVIKHLIHFGAEVNYIERDGRLSASSPLVVAALSGYIGIVKYLLDHGADPTLRDRRGVTVFDYFGSRIHDEKIKAMLLNAYSKNNRSKKPNVFLNASNDKSWASDVPRLTTQNRKLPLKWQRYYMAKRVVQKPFRMLRLL